MIRILILLSMIISACANLCFADVVDLPPTADVLVYETYPNTNYNHLAYVNWGKSSNDEFWGLIVFGGLSD